MLRLYNTAILPLRPLLALWAAVRSADPEEERKWRERRAVVFPEVCPDGIWIHGSSVGEARLVAALGRALRARDPGQPIVVSAFTATGRRQLPGAPEVDGSFFLPLDFRGYPSRAIESLRPAILVLMETELWPNLLHEASAAGVPVVVLNGRLSAERMARYRRFAGLYRPLLSRLTRVGAQTVEDAQRFVGLGVPPTAVEVTGNIKYDLAAPARDPAEIRQSFGLPVERPVFVAGSTGSGEDAQVLQAFRHARRRAPGLLLTLAPRHPERFDEVRRLVVAEGFKLRCLSENPSPVETQDDVLLVDSVGQLAVLYGLATVAFVGGSLVPVGGHNLLEPALMDAPVVFGPHTHHVAGLAAALERAGAGVRVNDADGLGRTLSALLDDRPRRARMIAAARLVIEANRGALERSVALVHGILRGTTKPR